MPQRVAILGAALDLGAGRRGVDMGPSAIRYAGLRERLVRSGLDVEDWGNVQAELAETRPRGSERARFLLVTDPAGFEGFIRALAVPATAPEIPPAPTAPPDMAPVLRAAADHGLEILGPPGIPA